MIGWNHSQQTSELAQVFAREWKTYSLCDSELNILVTFILVLELHTIRHILYTVQLTLLSPFKSNTELWVSHLVNISSLRRMSNYVAIPWQKADSRCMWDLSKVARLKAFSTKGNYERSGRNGQRKIPFRAQNTALWKTGLRDDPYWTCKEKY